MGIRISEMEEATTFGADDYVPIVTSGTNKKALGQKIKDFIAGFFVSKSGDTMTGDLIINKRSGKIYHKTPSMTVDTSANNGLTQNSYCDFGAVDSNDYMYAWAESGASTYGFNTMALGVRNKDTNGNVISNSLTFRVNKDGTVKTTVDQPQEFRAAIGALEWMQKTINVGTTTAGTSVTLGTLSDLTGGIVTAQNKVAGLSFIGGGGSGNYASGDLTAVSNTVRWYPRVSDTNVSITIAIIYSL